MEKLNSTRLAVLSARLWSRRAALQSAAVNNGSATRPSPSTVTTPLAAPLVSSARRPAALQPRAFFSSASSSASSSRHATRPRFAVGYLVLVSGAQVAARLADSRRRRRRVIWLGVRLKKARPPASFALRARGLTSLVADDDPGDRVPDEVDDGTDEPAEPAEPHAR